MTKKSFDIGHKLRALELGQDRYRRRYCVNDVDVIKHKAISFSHSLSDEQFRLTLCYTHNKQNWKSF